MVTSPTGDHDEPSTSLDLFNVVFQPSQDHCTHTHTLRISSKKAENPGKKKKTAISSKLAINHSTEI